MSELPPPTWADFVAAWDLYRDPVLCAGLAGAALGFLSSYVVLRRMVFLSAAVTQAAGLGVALAFYAGIHWGFDVHPSYGAVALALLSAAALATDPERLGITRETLLGAAYALGGGAAVLVGYQITQEGHEIHSILYGPGVLVEDVDLLRVAVGAALVMTVHIWWFRGLTFASFDPVSARVQGLPVRILEVVLLLSIGAMIGVSARALGALPVFALSTLPATASLLLCRGHLGLAFAGATIIGAATGVLGYLYAFFHELPVGGSQTVVAVAFVVAAFAVAGASKIGARLLAGRSRGGSVSL